jgi:hypothetical protein
MSESLRELSESKPPSYPNLLPCLMHDKDSKFEWATNTDDGINMRIKNSSDCIENEHDFFRQQPLTSPDVTYVDDNNTASSKQVKCNI